MTLGVDKLIDRSMGHDYSMGQKGCGRKMLRKRTEDSNQPSVREI